MGHTIFQNCLNVKLFQHLPSIVATAVCFFLFSCSSDNRPSVKILPILDEDGAFSYINVLTGETFVPEEGIEGVTLFNDGLAVVQLPFDGAQSSDILLYNFVNEEGKPILPGRKFVSFSQMNDGVAWATELDGQIMMLKKDCTMGDTTSFLKVYPFYENKAVVCDSVNGWHVINKSGNILYRVQNILASEWVINDMLLECIEDEGSMKFGIMNINGKQVTPCVWDRIGTSNEEFFYTDIVKGFHSDRVLVSKDGKWGVINSDGETVINPQFHSLHIDGDLYMFEKNDKWGWCSLDGQYLINPQFREVGRFNGCELAPAQDEESREWGFVDREGKWVIHPQFEEAYSFEKSGYAIVEMDREYGLIDKKGKWVLNPQFYELISLGTDNRYLAEISDEKYCIVDEAGKKISKTEFKFNTRILNPYYLFKRVESDFVDYEAILRHFKELSAKIKITTSGDLKKTIGEEVFPKKNAWVPIETVYVNGCKMTLNVACDIAWTRVPDGRWSYKYVFNPDVKINVYSIAVSLGQLHRIEKLVGMMNWDSQSSTVEVEGKQYLVTTDYEAEEVKFSYRCLELTSLDMGE